MPPIKRKRAIKTCEYCYTHKIKCDKGNPCSSCLRMDRKCVYIAHRTEMQTGAEPARAKTKAAAGTKVPKLVLSTDSECSSMYYSRGFQPFLEPGLNRIVLYKMAQYTPKPEVLNYQNNGLNITASEIVQAFPPKSDFHEALWSYWYAIHPLIPILDQNDIQQKYTEFWHNLEGDNPVFDVNFALILLAMLFATNSAKGFNEKDRHVSGQIKTKKEAIYNLYEKIKINCGLNVNPTVDFLKASVIFLYTGSVYYIGIFSTTSMLSRAAEFIGLHRDPLLHHENPHLLSPKEIDSRRYIWNFIRYLDTSTSNQAGLSPHMILINASTEFPSKYDYNPHTGEFDGPLSPFRLFNITMFKSSLVLETVSHCLNFDFTSEEEFKTKTDNVTATIMALYRDVGGIIGELLACKGYSQELISFLVAHASGSVHRVFLLHLSGHCISEIDHNKIISRPKDLSAQLPGLDLKNASIEFIKNTLTVHKEYPPIVIQILILFIYETKDKVNTPESIKQFTWFSKNTNPLQYIFFLLRDIYAYPDRIVDMSSLPVEIQNFYIPPAILTHAGDLRRFAVDTAFDCIFQFSYLWPPLLLDVMNLLTSVKQFVYAQSNERKNEDSVPRDTATGDDAHGSDNNAAFKDVKPHNNNPLPWLPPPLPNKAYTPLPAKFQNHHPPPPSMYGAQMMGAGLYTPSYYPAFEGRLGNTGVIFDQSGLPHYYPQVPVFGHSVSPLAGQGNVVSSSPSVSLTTSATSPVEPDHNVSLGGSNATAPPSQ